MKPNQENYKKSTSVQPFRQISNLRITLKYCKSKSTGASGFSNSLCSSLASMNLELSVLISSKNGLITHFVFVEFSHFEVEEEGLQLSNPSCTANSHASKGGREQG